MIASHLSSSDTGTIAVLASVQPSKDMCGGKRSMLSVTDAMEKALERERKKRILSTIPETARVVLGEYLTKNEG
jgi:hypothetical protein